MIFPKKTSTTKLWLISSRLLILLKVGAGIATGSASIIAAAIHSVLGLIIAVIAFFSLRISYKPPDRQHPFGHSKIENISGSIEALLVFTAAILIIYEAVRKIIVGAAIELAGLGIGIMLVSVVVDILVSRRLHKLSHKTHSLALRANVRHLSADTFTSLGVLAGLIAIKVTGLVILDPIIAIGVAGFIVWTAYTVTRKSFGGLVDEALPDDEKAIIMSCILEHTKNVVGFHNLRTRTAGEHRYIDLHLVVARNATVEQAHSMCDHLERDIALKLSQTNIIIHYEPCETEDCSRCDMHCTLRPQKV